MKRKKTLLISTAIVFVITFLLYNSSNTKNKYSREYYYLGTINEVTILGINKSKSEKLLNHCDEILKDIENKMSDTIPGSDVSKINNNAGSNFVNVSDDTFFVIKEAIRYSNLSDGNFDITIGPISDLWGIGTKNSNVPSVEEIQNILDLVDYKNIILDESNKSIKLNKSNMRIDLGAIAKGYAADIIVDYLKANNVKSAIVNLGGNIYTLGSKNHKDPFTVGIQDPTLPRGNSIGNIKTTNKSVVTSGIYERYIQKGNKIYHHILNPYSGYPFENELSSVTIISNKSIICDALSTSVFGLGLEKGFDLIESLDNVDAILITKNKEIYLTSNIKNKFNLTDNSFKIINKDIILK
ncbi:FAD:protein FMN transferase [Romboutsia ilealis]|uniref:FAD:protein FMN transferase n=1 Tax=Romboutsia faecis TaxID=2764597 RepID=A0ABR7JLF0_9FIRM|nr:FAD:protein FMN transferase [Romboutsia faecis]MBC5995645.1 FAD:protein FMN transferase [Romboutsia faecis]MRN23847.1 FAD:protein FMN transferase [Romboutsia ilealis]